MTKYIDLSKGWTVKYFFSSEEKNTDQPHFKKIDNVNLPEFWFDLPPFSKIIYRKNFSVEQNFSHAKLYFDRLQAPAVIYLNDNKVNSYNGGKANFAIDIQDHIERDRNQLKIVVYPAGLDGRIKGKVGLLLGNKKITPPESYHRLKALKQPAWLTDAIIYELFTRVFSKKGDFNGIIEKLDYLEELGINCIWLMPVFPIGEKKRKGKLGSPYAIKNFKKVNPRLGSAKDLKRLIKKAHARDMKVILDIACNHAAWDNELIAENPEWFTRNNRGELVHPPETDWTDVVDIDYSNVEVREYMLEVLLFWVREFDADGFRMDVAEFIPLEFWTGVLTEMQRIKPDVLLLAEGDHPALHAKAFHLSYGWNTRLALFRTLKYNQPATSLKKVILNELKTYPDKSLKMRFTENHDLVRTVKIFGPKKSKVAAFLSFTIKGVPMIYAGQELGAKEPPSLFNKDGIKWQEQNDAIFNFYQELIELRKKNPILADGEIKFITNNQSEKVISFLRLNSDNEPLLVVANMTSDNIEVRCEPSVFNGLENNTRAFGNSDISKIVENRFEIEIPGYGYGIYKLKR